MRRAARDLLRLATVLGVSAWADGGPEPAVVLGVVLGLRHVLPTLGLVTGSRRLLHFAARLDQSATVATFLALVWCLAGLVGGMDCSALSAAAVGIASPAGSKAVAAELTVEPGRMRLLIHGPTALELRTDTESDERVAMVLCRLFETPDGRALLTHRQIAEGFGKSNRQDCQNHMQVFERAGESLSQMVLRGRRGRPPRVHRDVLALVADDWERHPLATPEETLRRIASRKPTMAVPLPTPDDIRATRELRGNLVPMRNATKRLLEAGGVAVRPSVLVERLLEVVHTQNRRLRARGIEPEPIPGEVAGTLGERAANPPRPSRAGRELSVVLEKLTRPVDPETDEALCNSVRLPDLSPLHFGALYSLLRLSVAQVAALTGRSKSAVYRGLRTLARAIEKLDPFPAALGFSGVLGLDEKWLRIPKSFSQEEMAQGKRWRYAHFAVDALTGDLLHVDVLETCDANNVRAFLVAVRARGIRPRVVVTDMLAAYDNAIREVFGPGTRHHLCLFHHLQAVRHRLREKYGADWKKEPLLRELVRRVDRIYDCRDRRTARKRLVEALAMRPELRAHHDAAAGLLDIVEQRFPKVVDSIGNALTPTTNNATERLIRAFCRHYDRMAGLESIETARIQLRLFRFFYRLTPWHDAVWATERGLCPLERAGFQVRGIPVADYVRRFVEASAKEGCAPSLQWAAPPRAPPAVPVANAP